MKTRIIRTDRLLCSFLRLCLATVLAMLCAYGLFGSDALAATPVTTPQYRIWVQVHDYTQGDPSYYDSSDNSAGYIVMPTVRQDGTPGTTWWAKVNEGDWDVENGAWTYHFQSEKQDGQFIQLNNNGTLAQSDPIDGFPTEIRLVKTLSPTATDYITNDNNTYTSWLYFDIFVSTTSGGMWNTFFSEKTMMHGKFSDSKKLNVDTRPRATYIRDVSFDSDVYVNPARDTTYQVSFSCSDQYGAQWYQDNAFQPDYNFVVYHGFNNYSGFDYVQDKQVLTISQSGLVTVSRYYYNYDTQPKWDLALQISNPYVSQIKYKPFKFHNAQFTVTYYDESGGIYRRYPVNARASWTHPIDPPQKASTDEYHYTGTWQSNDSTVQVWRDIYFRPSYRSGYHDWDDGVYTVRSTDDPGCAIRYTCRECGYQRIEYEDEHLWETVYYLPASCTASGAHNSRCSRCKLMKYESVPAGHKLQLVAGSEPTCETSGRRDVYKCSDCGKYFTTAAGDVETTLAEQTLPALGHAWGSPEYTWSADFATMSATRHCQHDTSHTTVDTQPGMYYLDGAEEKGVIAWQTVTADTTAIDDGWWAVTSDTTLAGKLTVWGDVHLILCDGAALVAPSGIQLVYQPNLHIHLQSGGTGTLEAHGVNAITGVGEIILPDGVAVTAGNTGGDMEKADYVTRDNFCRLNHALIGLCDVHDFELNAEWGTKTCGWCGVTEPVTALDYLSGKGTERNPYRISSASDWNSVADYVNNGGGTHGVVFCLTNSISVSTMMGTDASPFAGVFDGFNQAGRTLTVSLNSSDSFCAPFRYIQGATIRNLTVEGSVSGGIHCAGLVGTARGTNSLVNCEVNTTVTCASSHCGGVLGHAGTSNTTLNGVVFNGSVAGADNVGTLWGWSDSGSSATLIDCLDQSDTVYPIGLGSGTQTIVNTLYTRADKGPGASRVWNNRGALAYGMECISLYPTMTGESGILRGNMLYAAAGDPLSFTATDVHYLPMDRLVVAAAGQGVNVLDRLWADADGAFSLEMPGMDCVLVKARTVTFVNDDGTVLETGLYAYSEMPEYTGEVPTKAPDERHIYAFAGWTPTIAPVNANNTVYTAAFADTPILLPGANTVPLEEYVERTCVFVPTEDGDYRFRTAACSLHPVMQLKDGDTQIAADYGYEFTINFVAPNLEAGKTYSVVVESLHYSGELEITVQRVIPHAINVAEGIEHATVYGGTAYEGDEVWLRYEQDEGYALAEASVTDANGNPVQMEYEGFTMPDADVTIDARFDPAYGITYVAGENTEFQIAFIDGAGGWYENIFEALPGKEVQVMLLCAEDYQLARFSVTGESGADIPYTMITNGWDQWDFWFTMPGEPITLTATAKPKAIPFEPADFTLPASLTVVEPEAFMGGAMTAVYVPDGCNVISARAFGGCQNLARIRIPASCYVEDGAFDGCLEVEIYGASGTPAEAYCDTHANCVFVEEALD